MIIDVIRPPSVSPTVSSIAEQSRGFIIPRHCWEAGIVAFIFVIMMQGLQYRAGGSAAPGTVASAACRRPSAATLQLGRSSVDDAEEETMTTKTATMSLSPLERVQRLASDNAVLVFSVTSCCMCHVVKRLFCGLGVNPAVFELDEEGEGAGNSDMEKVLVRLVGKKPAVPAVFIGGELVGGLDRLMAAHISGELVPKLKQAGALWL